MLRLLLIAPVAAASFAGGARACTDASNMASYFSHLPPERIGDTPMLRVRVLGIEEGEVSAQLDGSFERLSSDGKVRIELSELPMGSNCIEMGPTEGPVFVLGTLRQTASGELSLVAIPTRSSRRRVRSRRELERYIVDPTYLSPAPQATDKDIS